MPIYINRLNTGTTLANLTDTDVSTVLPGNTIIWNGVAWVPSSLSGIVGVTSVGLSLPAEFTISGSPVTTTGTLTGAWATQAAKTVFAGPTTGGPAVPTFRLLSIVDFIDPSYYVSDTAAGGGGVSIGELYKLDTANIFGLPKGIIKERIV